MRCLLIEEKNHTNILFYDVLSACSLFPGRPTCFFCASETGKSLKTFSLVLFYLCLFPSKGWDPTTTSQSHDPQTAPPRPLPEPSPDGESRKDNHRQSKNQGIPPSAEDDPLISSRNDAGETHPFGPFVKILHRNKIQPNSVGAFLEQNPTETALKLMKTLGGICLG